MPLTPNNREEHWLKGMVDGSTDLTPNNRKEHWYQEIINAGGGGGGGGGGVLVANVSFGEGTATLDKTWQQIHDGLLTGIVTAVINIEESMEVTCYYVISCSYDTETSKYLVSLSVEDFPMFSADSSSDYPVAQMG